MQGLINRQKHINDGDGTKSDKLLHQHQSLRELYLSGNDGIGDGGTAALAAALKTASKFGSTLEKNEDGLDDDDDSSFMLSILDTLDLSACGVGDAGVGALAMAIESNPGCVTRLDLSNNAISDDGAIALSKGLIAGYRKSNKFISVDCIDLSNNVDIGDEGAKALFDAVECGAVRSLSLRSCSIKWRGASALGDALGRMISSSSDSDEGSSDEPRTTVEVDISGNHIGKKAKKTKQSVSTNMMNNLSFIGKRLKSGLKDVGLSNIAGSSLESDDESELMDSMGGDLADNQSSNSRCGGCVLYESLSQELDADSKINGDAKLMFRLGVRMCNFDEQGIDALCAACVLAGDSANVRLCIDYSMNGEAIDDEDVMREMIQGNYLDGKLRDVSEKHLDAMDRFGYGEDVSDSDNDEDNYDDYTY